MGTPVAKFVDLVEHKTYILTYGSNSKSFEDGKKNKDIAVYHAEMFCPDQYILDCGDKCFPDTALALFGAAMGLKDEHFRR